MSTNVGTLDRILRLVLGAGLIAVAMCGTGEWRWVGLAGPVLILTALFRFCPAYWLLRIRTSMQPS